MSLREGRRRCIVPGDAMAQQKILGAMPRPTFYQGIIRQRQFYRSLDRFKVSRLLFTQTVNRFFGGGRFNVFGLGSGNDFDACFAHGIKNLLQYVTSVEQSLNRQPAFFGSGKTFLSFSINILRLANCCLSSLGLLRINLGFIRQVGT